MAYIGKSPTGTGVRSRYYYTATGGETSLSGADDNSNTLVFSDGNYVDVSLNGIALVAGTDYNTSTANTIGGLSALSASDIVEVVVYDIFTVADTVSAKDGGTFSGAITANSGLNVGTIKEATGTTTAMTIDSTGRVTMANTVEIDQWNLSASFSTNSATITGWQRFSRIGSGYAGTGMTESSGVFTFPSTGLWKVNGTFLITAASGDTSCGLTTQLSTDSGSNYTQIGGVFESQSQNTSGSFASLINVTNASTFRFKLVTNGLDSGSSIGGNSAFDYSALIFERITDSQ